MGAQPRVRQNTENSVASMSHLSYNSGGSGTPRARSKIVEGDKNSSDSEEEDARQDTVSIAASDQLDHNMDEIRNMIAV